MTNCPVCQSLLATIPAARLENATPEAARVLRGRSTKEDKQYERMLAALRIARMTTDDFRKMGIYQASARIHGLRKMGYVIETELFDGWSADGYSHARMARYTLIEEPLALDASTAREGRQQPAHGLEAGEAACN